MASDLRITVRFLQPYFHGRGEDGFPEWPPSPLRLFQALVASSIGRQVDPVSRARTATALTWLEGQKPPEIVAPPPHGVTEPYRLFVPDNVGDRVAKAWSSRRDADIAEFRTEKDVRSVRLSGDALHYVFRDVAGMDEHFATLRAAARTLTHLGWGLDMVAGDASSDPEVPVGERWLPGRRGGPILRVPVSGTLGALDRRHGEFLHRLDGGTFRPVSPLAVFDLRSYARATDPLPPPWVGYRLIKPLTGDRLSLDPARRSRDVAAWTRHAVAEVCESWPFGDTGVLVHGHGGAQGSSATVTRPRLSYLPLPTINPRRVEGVARVLVTATPGLEDELGWIRSRLAGHELTWKDEAVALLEPLPDADWVLGRYIGRSDRWSTVTPVVIPGHDDRSSKKAERLLHKAFLQAGFDEEVVAGIRELEWRNAGFRPGVELATRHLRPDKVNGPVFHVRVRFGTDIVGPMAIGSGRHRGLGLFAISDR